MIVVSMTKCPPKLRGDLSKWLLEINTGVYVGKVSARVREALWQRICENISDGQATMVFSAQNEQHMDFYVHNNKSLMPVDFDGIKLIKHLNKTQFQSDSTPGCSNVSGKLIGKRRRNSVSQNSYVLLDIETTGLSAENNEIIEIGIVDVSKGRISSEKNWLVKIQKNIPTEIQKLTGITDNMLQEQGFMLCDVLSELFEIIDGRTVLMYNAAFDLEFLEHNAKKCEIEFPYIHINDVFITAKSMLKGLDNYKLETVSLYLGAENRQSHRALQDCHLLKNVYEKLNKF
ncbi:MAG TPA: type I-E CRISPR-associated endoribonuclease Cas2 [Ruminococcus sp.]|nr:type I-E CRISPR-associated endoribonuclease Cas2 [Ruminococcus sp.]HCR72873.1 type I-E CRISPR-associated endoribonuclease Cas2 [Ruminococcus sp.]